MSFELAQGSKLATGTTVAGIAWDRLGENPLVHLRFAETSEVKRGPFYVAEVETGEDSSTLVLAEFQNIAGLPDREAQLASLKGGVVERYDRQEVGKVVSVNPAEGSITLDRPVDASLKKAWVRVKNTLGLDPSQVAEGGKQWTLSLDTANHALLARTMELLGLAHADAAWMVLQELVTAGKTDLAAVTYMDVLQAVQAGAAKGQNLEGFVALHAQTVERERRAGLLDVPVVDGIAP